ncbi:aldo/keto reductase [Saccharopolyspora shandongensis]|uniref:aldo/keto reductase n=1 Tax=Saccharopolyspora shandongensis TaxID=418495 RepID=UPI003425282A
MLHGQMRLHDVALEQLRAAAVLAAELDDPRMRTMTVCALGEQLCRVGATQEAGEVLAEALDLAQRTGDVLIRGFALTHLGTVADELGVTMAQVALNWVATQPGIASAIAGASSAEQLGSSLAALDFEIPAELRADLDAASAVPPGGPYVMFTPEYQSWIINAGVKLGDKPAGYHPAVRNWVPES